MLTLMEDIAATLRDMSSSKKKKIIHIRTFHLYWEMWKLSDNPTRSVLGRKKKNKQKTIQYTACISVHTFL